MFFQNFRRLKKLSWITVLITGFFCQASSAFAASPVKVVTSFSVLEDLVQQIGGDKVEIVSLVKADGDAHVYNPTPADSRKITAANLVVMNGLNFEPWAERLVRTSGYKGTLLVVSKGIKVIPSDPHAWQDVGNVKIYSANIRDALIKIDPVHRDYYESRYQAYNSKLDALDLNVKTRLAAIPDNKRKVITSHDAFTYYGKAYNIKFLAPQGVSTEAEPSAKNVATLIQQIKRENIKTLFVENISNQQIINRIARETGSKIGGTLYADALSQKTGPASTYINMIEHNTALFEAAMKE